MQTDFNNGASYARDLILSTIIGMQNECSDKDSQEYSVLQNLFERIENYYGDFATPFQR